MHTRQLLWNCCGTAVVVGLVSTASRSFLLRVGNNPEQGDPLVDQVLSPHESSHELCGIHHGVDGSDFIYSTQYRVDQETSRILRLLMQYHVHGTRRQEPGDSVPF
jgi:hypothetical protein